MGIFTTAIHKVYTKITSNMDANESLESIKKVYIMPFIAEIKENDYPYITLALTGIDENEHLYKGHNQLSGVEGTISIKIFHSVKSGVYSTENDTFLINQVELLMDILSEDETFTGTFEQCDIALGEIIYDTQSFEYAVADLTFTFRLKTYGLSERSTTT